MSPFFVKELAKVNIIHDTSRSIYIPEGDFTFDSRSVEWAFFYRLLVESELMSEPVNVEFRNILDVIKIYRKGNPALECQTALGKKGLRRGEFGYIPEFLDAKEALREAISILEDPQNIPSAKKIPLKYPIATLNVYFKELEFLVNIYRK